MMKNKNRPAPSDILYELGAACVLLAVAVLFVCRGRDLHPARWMLPCLLHTLTGYYCPGCGGTRAVQYLLAGKWLKSLYYYPLVVCTVCWYLGFWTTYTVERHKKITLRYGIHAKEQWLWVALVLVAANCVVKNLILFLTGISLIP
jgi:hypothetical protein